MHDRCRCMSDVCQMYVRCEFPEISLCALKQSVDFGSTYLCETGFSALVCMKSKYRSQLDVTAEMRCTLSTTAPDLKACSEVCRCSHPIKCRELRQTIIIHESHHKLKLKQKNCDTFHLSNLHCGQFKMLL